MKAKVVLQGRIGIAAPILHRRMASRQNAPSVCDTACLGGAVQGTRDTSDESSESQQDTPEHCRARPRERAQA